MTKFTVQCVGQAGLPVASFDDEVRVEQHERKSTVQTTGTGRQVERGGARPHEEVLRLLGGLELGSAEPRTARRAAVLRTGQRRGHCRIDADQCDLCAGADLRGSRLGVAKRRKTLACRPLCGGN